MKTAYAISVILAILSAGTLFGQEIKTTKPVATEFKPITIGSQQWMTENLNVGTFSNGEPIPEAKTKEEWLAAYKNERAAWCYYNNDPANGKKYGRLYNWYAVNDPRGLAPKGWHVPTDKEWQILVTTLGGEGEAFVKMKSSTGFRALPGGERWFEDEGFYKAGEIGFWWSATANDKWNAWYQALHFGYSQIGQDNGGMNTGFSVRCIKDH
jgi:uncharacterized protein (TIGR02145 family)